jgi:hypothetical protein
MDYAIDDESHFDFQHRQEIIFFICVETNYGAPPVSHSMGTGECFLTGLKQVECKADHSPPPSAEGKNVWSNPSTQW